MIYKQRAIRICSSITNKNVKSQREETQKSLGRFFSFSFFETFRNLERELSIKLNKYFWIFWKLHYFLLKIRNTIKLLQSVPLEFRYIRYIV